MERNQMHGPQRCPVGGFETIVATSAGTGTGAALARWARRVERRVMGSSHGSSLARPALPLPTVPDLPSSFSAVGARRHPHRRADGTGRRLARPRQDRPVGNLHRRQLQQCEKRGSAVGPTRRGKGSKIMAIVDRHGLPIAVSVASASPHETQLVEATLQQRFLPEVPAKMIGDRAYDSERLDQQLRDRYGIELIAPHNVGRVNPPTQDGRPLRRYRRRWKIERFFAWLHNSRRLVTRWEYHAENFLTMIHLACILIFLRHLLL